MGNMKLALCLLAGHVLAMVFFAGRNGIGIFPAVTNTPSNATSIVFPPRPATPCRIIRRRRRSSGGSRRMYAAIKMRPMSRTAHAKRSRSATGGSESLMSPRQRKPIFRHEPPGYMASRSSRTREEEINETSPPKGTVVCD